LATLVFREEQLGAVVVGGGRGGGGGDFNERNGKLSQNWKIATLDISAFLALVIARLLSC
jgi:hypothetical protein